MLKWKIRTKAVCEKRERKGLSVNIGGDMVFFFFTVLVNLKGRLFLRHNENVLGDLHTTFEWITI